MEHSVQIDPEKCVIVMGPQMAAEALSLSEGVPAALSYAMLVNIGIQRVLELDKTSASTDKSRKHTLLVNAYELEPAFAAYKVVETLKENNAYKEWLTELFGSLPSLHSISSSRQKKESGSSIVETLAALQREGVLLVYTHYDTILDVQMGTSPVLLQEADDVRNWATSHKHGILHVHGIFSKPDSVFYDCVDYGRLVGDTPAGQALKDVLKGRSVIFAGFDGEFYDPFLPKFSRTFLSHEHPPPLLLSAAPKVTNLTETFLNLRVAQFKQLDKLIVPRPPAAYLGSSRDQVEKKLTTTLLYGNKASCLEAAELVKVMSEVNVHQLTMRHERLHHLLLLYLDRDGLKELWKLIFASKTSSSQPGLRAGLLGVVLDDAVTVWLDGGMTQVGVAAQQDAGMPMALHMEGSRDQQSAYLPLPPLPPSHLTTPLSLSTNVAVIGSTWTTPIPTPSISRPLSTASSSSTSMARIGHTSPLVSSTSRTSLGAVVTHGHMADVPPVAMKSILGGGAQRSHNQVRRVKSEHLMYRDRLGKPAIVKGRNGLLLHRESAPEFVQTSEGLVAYPSNPSNYRGERLGILVGGQSKASSSSPHHHHSRQYHMQPSPLVKGGAHMEVKIENPDMQRQGHPMSLLHPLPPVSTAASVHGGRPNPSGGSGGSSSPSVPRIAGRSEGSLSSGGIVIEKEFSEEKQKFIMEAQTWSRQVDSDLAKKLKLPSSAPSSATSTLMSLAAAGSSVGGAYPLGFIGAPPQLAAASVAPSLTSKFSPEEQEKLLKQHFEQIAQQQHQMLSVAGMVPSLPLPVAIPSPVKSPVGTGGGANQIHHQPASSVNTATSTHGHAHSRQQPVTPLPPTAQTSSSAVTVGSPKKTSPLGILQATTTAQGMSAPPLSMFPFLPTSGGPAAGLLCNPSLSQFPMAAAATAMFNPMYQATFQKLAKSGQVPALPPDPALFQGLMDKVPVVLADGRITFIPLGAATQQGSMDPSPSKESLEDEDNQEDDEDEEENEEENEDTIKSPIVTGCKRVRSPGPEGRGLFRDTPPKRRRSSSLPDITQLLHTSASHKKYHEDGSDGEGGSKEKVESGRDSREKKSNGITAMMASTSLLGSSSPRPRQQAPPTMIHIPKDMKMSEPMLGFPTPPQSSPLRGGFSLSPVVLPPVQYHHHQHQPMTPVTPGQDSLHNAEELRDMVEMGDLGGATLPPSPEGSSLPPFPAGRGPIQLWQFLLDLLLSPDKQHMIHWTGNGYEFCILLPEDIAKLWGARKNKPRMNYDKLSRGLRYYYNKGIMDKVQGKKLTFKYTCDVHHYIRSRNAQGHGSSTPRALSGGEFRSRSSTPVLMPMSDGLSEGDEGVGEEVVGGAPIPITGDRGRRFKIGSEEVELATPPPPPVFHHQVLKKPVEVSFGEGEGPRCDIQGLMGMMKAGYSGMMGVVEHDNHAPSSRIHTSLCSEAV